AFISSSDTRSMLAAGRRTLTLMSAIAFLVILLEQRPHVDWRGLAAVRHDRRDGVGRAVDFPAGDGHRVRSGQTARPRLATLALRSRLALAAGRRNQLPAVAWAGPRIIAARDERRAVERHNAQEAICLAFAVGAADRRHAGITPRSRDAGPV